MKTINSCVESLPLDVCFSNVLKIIYLNLKCSIFVFICKDSEGGGTTLFEVTISVLSEVAEENHNNKSGVPVIQPRIKYVVT
jgi:hypothetical protein